MLVPDMFTYAPDTTDPLIAQAAALLEFSTKGGIFEQFFPAMFKDGVTNLRPTDVWHHLGSLRRSELIGGTSLKSWTAMPGNVACQAVPFGELVATMPALRKAVIAMFSNLYTFKPFPHLLVCFAFVRLQVVQAWECLAAMFTKVLPVG